MLMKKAIKDFEKQLKFEPVIENDAGSGKRNKFLVCGMGGSHLAADLIKTARPDLDVIIHSNYGLPEIDDLKERMVIANSYSGNTEETLDSLDSALKMKLNAGAISTGGKLIGRAKSGGIPFVKIPDIGIQPRMAVGFSVLAILKLMGEEGEISDIKKIEGSFDLEEKEGGELAKKLESKIPIVYASEKNRALAMNWKVIFNETGKIPSFYNVFPELNHNEMTGFDLLDSTKNLSGNFVFVFLRDSSDHPGIIKRMDITEKLLKEKGFEMTNVEMTGINVWHKIFSSILTAEHAAYFLAIHYGADPEEVPMVEEFKKLL